MYKSESFSKLGYEDSYTNRAYWKIGLRRLLNRFQNNVFVTAYKTFSFDLDNLMYTCVLLASGIGIAINRGNYKVGLCGYAKDL